MASKMPRHNNPTTRRLRHFGGCAKLPVNRAAAAAAAVAVAPSPGERIYLALVRSGVAWRDVPRLSGFLFLWGCQPPERRRALLASQRVFAAQLTETGEGETSWAVAADDARTFLAWGLPRVVLRDANADYARNLIEAGAARCLRTFLTMRGTNRRIPAGFDGVDASFANPGRSLLEFAIECAQPDCVRELLARGAPLMTSALNVATLNGNLRTLRLAIDGGAELVSRMVAPLSVPVGHGGQSIPVGNAFYVAVIVGSLPCLRMLVERGPWAAQALDRDGFSNIGFRHARAAVEFGHLACLRYLHRRISFADRTPYGDSLGNALWPAIRGGFLDCMAYVLEHHIYEAHSFEGACAIAAECNRLAVLVFLRERVSCPWDERTCIAAAKAGSLECLRYAHENGCPWTESTVISAAAADALECMRYAIDRGCPFDAKIAKVLAKSRCRAYLLARGV